MAKSFWLPADWQDWQEHRQAECFPHRKRLADRLTVSLSQLIEISASCAPPVICQVSKGLFPDVPRLNFWQMGRKTFTHCDFMISKKWENEEKKKMRKTFLILFFSHFFEIMKSECVKVFLPICQKLSLILFHQLHPASATALSLAIKRASRM